MQRMRQLLLIVLALAALAGVFALYLRPDFLLQLSNQILPSCQTMTIPLGPLDIDTHYPLALVTVAPMSDPTNTYPMADAINNEPDVPEPATMLAMLAGIGSVSGYLRRRRQV